MIVVLQCHPTTLESDRSPEGAREGEAFYSVIVTSFTNTIADLCINLKPSSWFRPPTSGKVNPSNLYVS
jgi:hypothetical protein